MGKVTKIEDNRFAKIVRGIESQTGSHLVRVRNTGHCVADYEFASKSNGCDVIARAGRSKGSVLDDSLEIS